MGILDWVKSYGQPITSRNAVTELLLSYFLSSVRTKGSDQKWPLTNTMLSEPEGFTPLKQKLTTGHDTEPFSFTFDHHNPSP
jgi:hypothetical protein